MKPEDALRDRNALEIFSRAVEMPGAEARATYVEEACAGDIALTVRVEALLANHVEDSFLQKPAAGPDPGSPANVSISEQAGDRIGRYKLLQRIGEGGCGVVYMAEQEEPVRRRVALKVIKLGMDTRQVVARFEAERQALAMMDHPNIARVFDAGATDAGRPYFVMELVRGVRITEFCDQQRLSTRQRLDLFLQICSAIQHAHQKGIIHRDLKPSNILVTTIDGTPVPKVIDFGIAKATNQQRLTDKTLFTAFEQFIGTPAYMSPEQAEMSGVDIDTRSDIYSLGVVLYELLTGRTPFDAGQLLRSGLEGIRKTLREREPSKPSTALDTLAQADLTTVARARHTEPPRLLHQVRGDLDWVVMKCLEKDRGRRYETANGLAQDLQRHLQHEPVTARPPSAAYKFQKMWQRNRLAFTAGAALAAALVIGLGLSTWALFYERESFKRVTAAEAEQRRERTNAEKARETATQERDRAAILLSHSQAQHGVQLLEKSDPAGLLYLLESRKSVEHLPEERMRRTLLWSGWMDSLPKPEGRVLPTANVIKSLDDPHHPWQATGTTNGQVILRETATGVQVTTFKTGNRTVGTTEFSANGRLLLVNADGTFQLWDLAPVRSNQRPQRLVGKVFRWAFDAKRLRVVTFSNQGVPERGEPTTDLPPPISQVQVWDSRVDSSLVSTWEGNRSDLSNHQLALSPDGSTVATGWRSLTLWDAKTGRRIQPQLSTNGISASRGFDDPLCFSPDGRWLWEVRGHTCLRYDRSTGELVGEPIVGLHRWNRPWVTPTGRHLVLVLEGGFQVVHLDRGENMGPLIPRDEVASTRALALSIDGGRLATAGSDRAIQVWDTLTGQQVGPTIVPPSPGANATFSSDGQLLTITTKEGRAQLYRLTKAASASVQEWSGTQIIGFNEKGHLLTYTPSKHLMQWRDPGTGEPVSADWMISNHGPLLGSAMTADGATVATAFKADDNQSVIRFWDAVTGAEQGDFIRWTNVGPLAFSTDGKTLAGLGGGDGSIQLWDVAGRERRSSMSLPEPPQVSWLGLRFSPDGHFIAARNSYVLSVWDLEARKSATGSERDFVLAISQDWKMALTENELLDFTDPRKPRPALKPINSRNTPSDRGGLAISPDNRLRTSGTGRFWDIVTGRPVGQERKNTRTPTAMAFSPDSRLFVTSEIDLTSGRGGERGALRVWETSTGLSCGRAVPQSRMTIDLWFDQAVRFLAVSAPYDAEGAQVIKLPVRELPLEEMQRQSWLLSGSRLDEAGNVEILSLEEIRQLEESTAAKAPSAKPPSAKPQEPAAPVRSPAQPNPQPMAAALPREIKAFIATKEQQARLLARRLNSELPPDGADYFRAAQAGNWEQAHNTYISLSQRSERFPREETAAIFQSIRQPMLETHIVLEYYSQAQPKYATAFGRDIIASIPAGSIYFGGTDAGRGLVTALSKSHAEGDPFFTITQNALADGSYLDYVGQMYGLRMAIPTQQETQAVFQDYMSDARRRLEHDRTFPGEPKQVRLGEEIQVIENRVQIGGQVAVMSLNARLARLIFDRNPRNEFYVEESYALDWMYPYLEPHGLIMKLNRQPLERLSPEAVKRDHEYWNNRLKPMVGDWLKEDTTVLEVCEFIDRVFVREELKSFDGDPAYVGDAYACKAFSRLRTSIAGLYQWRGLSAKDETERKRMKRAADFAFLQAVALCPYSPEAISRYVRALANDGREDDARRVARMAAKFPETKVQAERLITELASKKLTP